MTRSPQMVLPGRLFFFFGRPAGFFAGLLWWGWCFFYWSLSFFFFQCGEISPTLLTPVGPTSFFSVHVPECFISAAVGGRGFFLFLVLMRRRCRSARLSLPSSPGPDRAAFCRGPFRRGFVARSMIVSWLSRPFLGLGAPVDRSSYLVFCLVAFFSLLRIGAFFEEALSGFELLPVCCAVGFVPFEAHSFDLSFFFFSQAPDGIFPILRR